MHAEHNSFLDAYNIVQNNKLPSSQPLGCMCCWGSSWTCIWRSERGERSHSRVIKIKICDIYMYSMYVRIYPPGGWLQSERSRVRTLLWNFFFLSLSLSLSLSPFFLPSFLPLPFSPSCSLCHFNAQAFF